MYMETMPSIKPPNTWRIGWPVLLPLSNYPTAKINAHMVRTPITYAVSVFNEFSKDSSVPPLKASSWQVRDDVQFLFYLLQSLIILIFQRRHCIRSSQQQAPAPILIALRSASIYIFIYAAAGSRENMFLISGSTYPIIHVVIYFLYFS